MLVLAGDVANGTRGIELFANWPVPVLYVPGNHEFYGLSWEQTRSDMRSAARGTSVVLLDNDMADLGRFSSWAATREDELSKLRFVGTTLWTDCLRQECSDSRSWRADSLNGRIWAWR